MPVTEIPERFNAASIFVDEHMEKGREHRPAILCGERTVDYGGLHENVNRFGNILHGLDVRMEERVAILLPDIPEFVFAFFGTMKMGAVAVPLNTLLGPGEYQYLLNDSRARVLVAHASLLKPLLPILGKLNHLKHILVCGGNIASYPRLEDFLRESSPSLDPADTSRDDAAFWLYSSGTTGFPKGVIHLHHDMVVAADQYAIRTLGIDESDLCFSVAKLFFAYGLGNGLYFPLRVGGTGVLLPEKPMPDPVFGIIDKYQPTIFYSVPTSYAALLQTAERTGRDSLGKVRLCVSAGEPLPKPLFDRWRDRFGTEILDGIGSTEALHIFISNRPGEARGGCTGRVVPGYEARIIDDNGNEVQPGEIGTLLIQGDSIAAGYWNKHEATKTTILGEWIDTRDKFRTDEDGFYYYAGRSDDMMKVGGQWVSPTEIEAILQQHPAVLESGVVGNLDEQGLMNPAAYTTLKEGFDSSAELALELQDFVRENTAPHHYSCWIEFIDELPKTATGKIRRFRLREMGGGQSTVLREGQTPSRSILRTIVVPDEALPAATPPEPAATRPVTDFVVRLQGLGSIQAQRDALTEYVQSQLAIVLGIDDPGEIGEETSFFDLEMDSIAVVVLTNRLQASLGYSLSATLLFKYSSSVALAGYIADEVLGSCATQGGSTVPELPSLTSTVESSLEERILAKLESGQLSDEEIKRILQHELSITGSISIEERRAFLRQFLPDKPDQLKTSHPLSYGQRRLWFWHQDTPDNSAYNTAAVFRVHSRLDVSALRAVFQTLLVRHPCLRSTFSWKDGQPVQIVHGYREIYFEEVDVSGDTEEELHQRVSKTYKLPFDLEQGPLLRVSLFTRTQKDHVLLVAIHHIVVDGWSFWMLLSELLTLYPVQETGRTGILPPLQWQYRDFIRWQTELLEGPEGERQWKYWQKQLSGQLSVLHLPTDRPRPPVHSYRGATVFFSLPATLTQNLKEQIQVSGVTLYTILLTAFCVLLHRYTGQEDILVGSPTAGRSRSEFEGIFGYFVNRIALRARLEGDPGFTAFLSRMHRTVLEGLSHQDYPFPLLVERLQLPQYTNRAPIFQVMFRLQKPQQDGELSALMRGSHDENWRLDRGGLSLAPYKMAQQEGSEFDLTLEMIEENQSLRGVFTYSTDLFEAGTIERMVRHFQRLLEGIVREPETKISQLPLLAEVEQNSFLVG
uniref:Benzoate-CoA ligase family n=1 Tax=Candidatus Kentrum sp. DK TaxID=2126562 RepID=A0A450S0L2_9GAMM|nr:MAG: benzoate-CoA ligase family [Candidatus Kentron sp. DK]